MIITASKHTYDLQLRRPSRTHEMRKKKTALGAIEESNVRGDMDNVAQ